MLITCFLPTKKVMVTSIYRPVSDRSEQGCEIWQNLAKLDNFYEVWPRKIFKNWSPSFFLTVVNLLIVNHQNDLYNKLWMEHNMLF